MQLIKGLPNGVSSQCILLVKNVDTQAIRRKCGRTALSELVSSLLSVVPSVLILMNENDNVFYVHINSVILSFLNMISVLPHLNFLIFYLYENLPLPSFCGRSS